MNAPVINFIDEKAHVPASTKVWHFARILDWVHLGEDCSVGSGAEVGRGSQIGDRTRISAGAFLPAHSVIGCDVFIGPNVTFTDDRYPRTLPPGEKYKAEPPVVGDNASIGAGAVILPGVRIGHFALVAAGAVVTKDVPAYALVVGNPARERPRWTNAPDDRTTVGQPVAAAATPPTAVLS